MSLDTRLAVTVGDDAVDFAFAAENAGDEPVDLTFRNGMTADVVVYDGDTEVWRWSDGRMFTQAVRTETLAPGGSTTANLTWGEPSPGTYTAEASLAATEVDAVARTGFDVP
ncbi:MAG: BsuPI-related putative proteinase inhibitor [Haloarculaceae archaeon]